MELHELQNNDIPSIWLINQEGLPGTGKISEKEIADLLSISELALGAYEENELVGFVICLPPKTRYGSLNYAWFNKRYEEFLYVDRIAVSENHRNCKIGTKLYKEVISHAEQNNYPIAAEVSLKPPNPASLRFHERNGFNEIGILHHESKSVTMMMRLS